MAIHLAAGVMGRLSLEAHAPNRRNHYRNEEERGRVRAEERAGQIEIRESGYSPFISSSSTGVSTTAAASASLESSLSLELDLLLLLLPRLGVTLLPPPESEW